MNQATIVGRLGAEPSLSQHGDTIVCDLRIATRERARNSKGEWHDTTEWHDVVVFGRLAETCAANLGKGAKVFVHGTLRTSKWEGRDGYTRQQTKIRATDVQFMSHRRAEPNQAPIPEQPKIVMPVMAEEV